MRDGWKPALALALALALTGVGPARAQPTSGDPQVIGTGSCTYCHQRLADDARLVGPTENLAFDRHAMEGIGCADCHGGDASVADPELAHDRQMGFVATPEPMQIVALCSRCHADPAFMIQYNPGLPTDQKEKYDTSRHGELLGMGLRLVANCASCHTAHNVRTSHDPASTIYPANLPATCAQCHADPDTMRGFPIPTSQFEEYAASVHGRALLEQEDLGAPACNDCHGNHGAVPPGTQSLAHVCGTCHAFNAELFQQSPHARIFQIQELGQCTTCHGHHAIDAATAQPFAMAGGGVCAECHQPDDAGWQTGLRMFAMFEELESLAERSAAKLDDATQLGMDVADGQFMLQDYRKAYLQLRTLTHGLDLAAMEETFGEARDNAEAAIALADGAIEEYHVRRTGLLVALLLSLPVILLGILKIRQMDRRDKVHPC